MTKEDGSGEIESTHLFAKSIETTMIEKGNAPVSIANITRS